MTSPFVTCDKLSLTYYYRMVQVSGAYLGPKYKNIRLQCLIF